MSEAENGKVLLGAFDVKKSADGKGIDYQALADAINGAARKSTQQHAEKQAENPES